MKIFLSVSLLFVLIGCNAPQPSIPASTLAASPTARPIMPPALVPPATPSSIPSTATPADKPAQSPAPSSAETLLPAWEQTIDLGAADFTHLLSSRLMALDDQADRLYLSLSPSRTVVLDANTLTLVGEIPSGGALSVNPAAQRLYIGVPGSYTYQPDGAAVIAPADLQLFDTTNLALLRRVIISDTAVWPPLVEVDPAANTVYVVQGRIYNADASTLEVRDVFTGTFPADPDASFSAVDAALLPGQQRLFVSLNNGLPGSNNGNVLAVYDLITGQLIAQDLERSLSGFTVDHTSGHVISPRSRPVTAALVKYDAQGRALKRLDGSLGVPVIDPAHNLIYLAQWEDSLQIKVLDRDLNFLGAANFPEVTLPQAVLFDPERDRLLALQDDGQLSVLRGQGKAIGPAAGVPEPARAVIMSILPPPQSDADDPFFALFAADEFALSQGAAFRSDDAGATWHWLSGLPAGLVNDLQSADGLLWAAAGGNGVDDGYGLWRSDDAGQTWQPASRGLTDLSVTRLAVSPDFARDGTLYALSQRGVFRSTDRGATWTSLADRYAPLLKDQAVSFSSLAVSPRFEQDNTLLIGHSSGLWRSTDRGETWTGIEGGPPATRLVYAPDGSLVFAVNYDGVQRSTDGGSTWQVFNAGLDLGNYAVVDIQINDREAVALLTGFGQPGAVYNLPLTETTWQRLPLEAEVSALALTPDGRLLLGATDGGLQRAP